MYWASVCGVDYGQFSLVAVFFVLSLLVFQVTSCSPYLFCLLDTSSVYTPFIWLQIRALTTPGAIVCIVLFFILYIPLYMLVLYIISYGFTNPYTSQGLLQTLVILVIIRYIQLNVT